MFTFRSKSYGTHNKKVIFLLTGWGMNSHSVFLFAKLLAYRGYHAIIYTYNSDILSPHIEDTVKNFLTVKAAILKQIQELKKKGIKEFSFLGISLGTTLSLMVANESEDISKIILNLTGADLVETVWGWGDRFHSEFKNEFKKNNISLDQLQKAWKVLNPITNIEKLHNKKLLIYVAKKDTIIPYAQGERFIEEVQKRGYPYKLVVNEKFNHVLSAGINMINLPIYMKFLNN